MRIFLLAAAAALLALPAAADGVATARPASLTRALTPQSQAKLSCRAMTHEGMVVGRPVCLTQEGWAKIGYQARKEFADFQHRHYSR